MTETGIGSNHQPQIADHFAFGQTEGLGQEQLGPQEVGRDDRIECLGERRQRKMLQQQKTCPRLRDRRVFMLFEVAKILALHRTAELTSLYQHSPRLVVLNKM